MNKKDLKIKKLYERGLDIRTIAMKCGYTGGALQAGMERVRQALKNLGITHENKAS